MSKEPPSRTKAKAILGRFVDLSTNEIIDPRFKEHVEYLRSLEDIDEYGFPSGLFPSKLNILMREFNLPKEMKPLIRNFLKKDKIDFTLVKSSLLLISEIDKTSVTNLDAEDLSELEDYVDNQNLILIIPSGATINEIVDFVRMNKRFIKEKQQLVAPVRRTKSRPNSRRDKAILELHQKGYGSKAISQKINEAGYGAALGYSDIRTIIARLKDK